MNNKKQKMVVFDYDGPLVDSWELAFERTKKEWPHVDEEFHRSLFGKNIFEEMSKLGPKHWSTEEEKEWLEKYYWPRKINLDLVEGMSEVIRNVSEDYILTVNTSSSSKKVEASLKRNEVSQYFSKIYGTEMSLNKVEKFKMIMNEYKLNADQLVLITDTVGDVREAKEAGVNSVLVTWGYQNEDHFKEIEGMYHKIVENPKELLIAIEDYFIGKPGFEKQN